MSQSDTRTKQGASDILDKMNFWYLHHYKEPFFFFFFFFSEKTVSGFLWKCNFAKSAMQEVSHSCNFGFDRLQKIHFFFFFVSGGKMFKKISQKLYGGDRRNMVRILKNKQTKKKLQNRQMRHFSPICQLQLPISQNEPVQLVPCFVGEHRNFTSFNGFK